MKVSSEEIARMIKMIDRSGEVESKDSQLMEKNEALLI